MRIATVTIHHFPRYEVFANPFPLKTKVSQLIDYKESQSNFEWKNPGLRDGGVGMGTGGNSWVMSDKGVSVGRRGGRGGALVSFGVWGGGCQLLRRPSPGFRWPHRVHCSVLCVEPLLWPHRCHCCCVLFYTCALLMYSWAPKPFDMNWMERKLWSLLTREPVIIHTEASYK